MVILNSKLFIITLQIVTFNFKHILLGFLICNCIKLSAQKLNANGGLIFKAEIALGNQNQWLKLGAFGYGTLNYGDISIENGLSFAIYGFSKRHTIKTIGSAYSYEYFILAGIGKNENLLGSSGSNINNEMLFDATKKGGFKGFGFGFEKDIAPKKLGAYNLKRGQFHIRFSNADYNLHFTFINDFRLGRIFNGEGTDYGSTGSMKIRFAKIRSHKDIYSFGVGLNLFTPQPDYSRSPRQQQNSDDGRKNVWFTLPPYKDLFYANFYSMATYQNENRSVTAKLGVNSNKLGAYIQNVLHDGIGLNPRFPWDVTSKNKLFIEFYESEIYLVKNEK